MCTYKIFAILVLTVSLSISSTVVAANKCSPLFSSKFLPTAERLPFDLRSIEPEAIPNFQALGFHPQISDSIEFAGKRLVYALDPLDLKKGVGSLSYLLFNEGRRLKVDYVVVAKEFRRNGISEALLAQVLRENPQITEIEALLDQTNGEVIKQKIAEGYGLHDAILASPEGRMNARFGFTKTIEYRKEGNLFFLLVSRPQL